MVCQISQRIDAERERGSIGRVLMLLPVCDVFVAVILKSFDIYGLSEHLHSVLESMIKSHFLNLDFACQISGSSSYPDQQRQISLHSEQSSKWPYSGGSCLYCVNRIHVHTVASVMGINKDQEIGMEECHIEVAHLHFISQYQCCTDMAGEWFFSGLWWRVLIRWTCGPGRGSQWLNIFGIVTKLIWYLFTP